MAENVMQALVAEVRRVAVLGERYKHVPATVEVVDALLDRAEQAAGTGEALDIIASLQELRGLREAA